MSSELKCPACGSVHWFDGPEGGLTVNIIQCVQCGNQFSNGPICGDLLQWIGHRDTDKAARLEASSTIPGRWECPKCKFSLSRTSIRATTGEMGTTWEDRQVPEMCSNSCGVQLQKVTWEAGYRDLITLATQHAELLQWVRDELHIGLLADPSGELLKKELQWRLSAKPRPVVCAIIRKADQVLISRRFFEAKEYGGLWELPGGKVEADETLEAALVREIHEELGCTIRVLSEYHTRLFRTENSGIVELHYFNCEIEAGEPHAIGCQAVQWVEPDRLSTFQMMPVDRELAHWLSLATERMLRTEPSKASETIFTSRNYVIPMADVSHIRKVLPRTVEVVTKHTTWNTTTNDYNNAVCLSGDEADAFLQAWCTFRSEIDPVRDLVS